MAASLCPEILWKDQDLVKIARMYNMVSDWSSYYMLMRLTHDIGEGKCHRWYGRDTRAFHLVPLHLVRQLQGPLLWASAGLWY
jgi:hypothetical protein